MVVDLEDLQIGLAVGDVTIDAPTISLITEILVDGVVINCVNRPCCDCEYYSRAGCGQINGIRRAVYDCVPESFK